MPEKSVVLDLGAYQNKFAISSSKDVRLIPNSISKAKNERRKVFIGDQLNDCKDFSGIYYVLPFQKGYLVNWDVQRQLFDFMYNSVSQDGSCSDSSLVITEPPFNFTSIKECLDEIMFEEYRFNSVYRTTPAQLGAWYRKKDNSENHFCCVVVDSGFSFTHIIPICNGKIIKKAVRRLDVGGKVLTNHLKDVISYRQLHVLDETYVMNQVKEDCCYVSNFFKDDMLTTQKRGSLNTIARDYVLPDYMNVKRGYIRPLDEMWTKYTGTEQLLRINNERFTIPEILFHPSDIGIQQMGIPEAIAEAISSCPVAMQPHLYMNVLLMGGNSALKGYKQRVFKDLRMIAPSDFDVNVIQPENPITFAAEGGMALSQHDTFSNFCVTKAEYEEHGRTICCQKFD